MMIDEFISAEEIAAAEAAIAKEELTTAPQEGLVTAETNENHFKQRRKRKDWRAAFVPKRPKILKTDPRRFFAFQFVDALNSGDVQIIWDFIYKTTKAEVMFRHRITGMPPAPLQAMNTDWIIRGQHRLCLLQYGRSQVFVDGMFHLKEVKLYVRSDDTAMIRAKASVNGSPIVSSEVIQIMDHDVEQFVLEIIDDDSKQKTVTQSSSSNAYSATAAVPVGKVPDIIYDRVHRLIDDATRLTAAAAIASVNNPTTKNKNHSLLQNTPPEPQ